MVEFAVCKKGASEFDEDIVNWRNYTIIVLRNDYGISPVKRCGNYSKYDKCYIDGLYYKCSPSIFRRILEGEKLTIDQTVRGIHFLKSEA